MVAYNQAEIYLASTDPILGSLIRAQGGIHLTARTDYFESLCRSIVSQQISVKAAATIFDRLRLATNLLPSNVRRLDGDAQRSIGLSGQKLRYLQSLAEHFDENPDVFSHLGSLDDDTVIHRLTRVNGVGAWTAQMFLIFTLARPDVFAPGDRGLQLAITKHYDLAGKATPETYSAIATSWKPYRSTACLHLWRSLDNAP